MRIPIPQAGDFLCLNISMATSNYIDAEELKSLVIQSYDENRISTRLGVMLMQIVEGVASKKCFSGYSYTDEMVADAIHMLCRVVLDKKLDATSSGSKIFNYISTCVHHKFFDHIKKEKKRGVMLEAYKTFNYDQEMQEQNPESNY